MDPTKARKEGGKKTLARLPVLETKKKWIKKIHPGISTFGSKPESVGEEHLKGLVEHVKSIVPIDEAPRTPIYLLATAGMRLLPKDQRKEVLAQTCTYFQQQTDFLLPDCRLHIQVIPGETEGLYGWIATNYLLGGFDDAEKHNHGNEHHTYGFLDMGGASAQIAFAPNTTEAEKHANDLTLLRLRTVAGEQKEYRVFVTTWLEYGVNEARRRYIKALLGESPSAKELPDPCLPSGLIETKEGKVMPTGQKEGENEAHLLGTGKFTECLKRTMPLLDKDGPCLDPPCLVHGVHTPAIDFKVNHFIGVSEYWHTTHGVFELGKKDTAYDFTTYQARVSEFCSQDWTTIQNGLSSQKWGDKVDELITAEVCFKASWIINMLHDGIGIPRVGLETSKQTNNKLKGGSKQALSKSKDRGFLEPFQAVDKIDGTEVSWTLGKMVLYAASQHAPVMGAMAVGFGSNIKGNTLAPDFQLGGERGNMTVLNELYQHNTVLSHPARQLSGIVLLSVVVFLVLFLWCGKQRRDTILSYLASFMGGKSATLYKNNKKKRTLFVRLFGGKGQSYERVDDEANDYELGDLQSNSDDDLDMMQMQPPSHSSSERVLRKISSESSISISSPKNGSRPVFDPFPGAMQTAVGVSGQGILSSRTDSRERLHSRSRQSSPIRRSASTAPYKSSID